MKKETSKVFEQIEKAQKGLSVFAILKDDNICGKMVIRNNPKTGTTHVAFVIYPFVTRGKDEIAAYEMVKVAFSANVAFRTRMFGRVAKMRTDLMTNSNLLQTISITNNNQKVYPQFCSGNYYIISVKNVIGWNITWPEAPHC